MARVKKQVLPLDEQLEQALVPESEWPYLLPKNWVWTRFKNITSIISKGTTPKNNKESYKDQGVGFLRIENIDTNGNIVHDAMRYISEDVHLSELKRSVLQTNDILVSIAGTLGRTAIVNENDTPLNTNQAIAFCRLCDTENILPNYIRLFIENPDVQRFLLSQTKVTSIPNLTLAIISNCPMAIPPLAEQQRIVAQIENLFQKLDSARDLVQNALDSFESRKAAILHKAFTGELTAKWRAENGVEIDSWKKTTLGKCGTLERGRSKHRPRNAPELFNGPYPFIQTGDVATSNVYVTKHNQTLSETGLQQSRLFPKGTLCITIAANIGDVAILSYDSCFPDSVVGFSPNEDVDSKFIYYMMSVLQKQLDAEAPATAQKNINLKVLNAVKITCPSFLEQQEIVRILDSLFENEQKGKDLCDILGKIDLMKKSILARAFRGELGTNDPNEESALDLLKDVLAKAENK